MKKQAYEQAKDFHIFKQAEKFAEDLPPETKQKFEEYIRNNHFAHQSRQWEQIFGSMYSGDWDQAQCKKKNNFISFSSYHSFILCAPAPPPSQRYYSFFFFAHRFLLSHTRKLHSCFVHYSLQTASIAIVLYL